MDNMVRWTGAVAGCVMMLAGCAGPTGSSQPTTSSQPSAAGMTFFVSSVGPGKGADLGGLEGADRHCAALATASGAAGAGQRTWRAYLSTQGAALNDPNFVNARDRIGSGPWHNAKGVMIARNVDDLHSANSNVTKQTALDEKGQPVNGRTEKPNKHDILTGSRPDGTAFPGSPSPDMTCGNWTKSGTDGSAMVGHHDRAGPVQASWATSWNSSHPSRGCNSAALQSTGGDGLLYCFAVK
ncbi:hypothetical protein D3870_06620 [Noviherbaspirillum cavernae]|uniref:Lectin n=1 Tax=Noviherbaspirillum cavernae TaxID=2320862 RepID=A0A418WZQ3_9BURK|nr:hypothetical protein D3870_06620 [Noviherbaspirillum cavernae]